MFFCVSTSPIAASHGSLLPVPSSIGGIIIASALPVHFTYTKTHVVSDCSNKRQWSQDCYTPVDMVSAILSVTLQAGRGKSTF